MGRETPFLGTYAWPGPSGSVLIYVEYQASIFVIFERDGQKNVILKSLA